MLLAAAVAILTGVVAVAMGWGGEMVTYSRDRPAVPLRARTASEVAVLRLPASLFGYQREATDAALHEISRLVADRDAEIADLRAELWRLRESQQAREALGDAPVTAGAESPAAAVRAPSTADDGERPAVEPASVVTGDLMSSRGSASGQPSPPS